jgi:hypothetical protein
VLAVLREFGAPLAGLRAEVDGLQAKAALVCPRCGAANPEFDRRCLGCDQAIGKDVRPQNVTPEVHRGFGFPGAADLGNRFQFKQDFEEGFWGAREL